MAEILSLNVGGVIYETTRSTLTPLPGSMLRAMDDKGHYFVDGDGPLFRFVLNFLRRSKLALPDDFKEFDMLLQEAKSYQLKSMVGEIEKMKDGHKQHRARETLEVSCESLIYDDRDGNEFQFRGEASTIDKLAAIMGESEDYNKISLHDSKTSPVKYVSFRYRYKDITKTSRKCSWPINDGEKGDLVNKFLDVFAENGFTLTSVTRVGVDGQGRDWHFIRF